MNCLYTDISKPKVIPDHSKTPTKNENNQLVTAPALNGCASFTSESAQFLASPKYSLFIQGIKAINSKSSGGYLSGLEQCMGALMIMASPIWGLLRVGIGLPCTILGAVATTVTGGAVGVEWSGRKVTQGAQQILGPSEKSNLREKLTEKFVRRMHETLKNMDYNEAHFFKQHPEQLVSIAGICVAFLSRKEEGKCLKAGDKIVSKEDIANQGETCKGYFNDLCEIKYAIQCLRLGLDDSHAWDYLMNALENLDLEDSEEKELSKSERNEIETLKLLMERACHFSEYVTDDAIFAKVWKKSLE